MENTVIVLTRQQRNRIIAESQGILMKALWKKYQSHKDFNIHEIDDRVQDANLWFSAYKDRKYRPTVGADLLEEIRKYKNFYLYTALQSCGRTQKEVSKKKLRYDPITVDGEEVYSETVAQAIATAKSFVTSYSDIDNVADINRFLQRVGESLKPAFYYSQTPEFKGKGYEIVRKLKSFIKQYRKGNQVSWSQYFYGKYAGMRAAVQAEFKRICAAVAADMQIEFA